MAIINIHLEVTDASVAAILAAAGDFSRKPLKIKPAAKPAAKPVEAAPEKPAKPAPWDVKPAADAPYGYKKDGTPRKKMGRPVGARTGGAAA